jgi:hypothetical protein
MVLASPAHCILLIAEKPNLSNRQDAFSTRGFRQRVRVASRREERLRAASRREEYLTRKHSFHVFLEDFKRFIKVMRQR